MRGMRSNQLDVVPLLLSNATPEAIMARPDSGQWSAHQNLAHLARHYEVFLQGLRRILSESAPQLGQYNRLNQRGVVNDPQDEC